MEKYGKILQCGDKLLEGMFEGEYFCEEKVDGSQFRAFLGKDGEMLFGSKEITYDDEHPTDKMFRVAVDNATKILTALVESGDNRYRNKLYIFEYLQSPKHNTIVYGRVPVSNIVLLDVFDIEKDEFAEGNKLRTEVASLIGLETPQILHIGNGEKPDYDKLLDTDSMLGGTKIEGIVIKNYDKRYLYHAKSYPMMGKFVNDSFKEMNKKEWNQGIPLEQRIMQNFPKEPRWEKAVQHIRDRGELTQSVKDIGILIREVEDDFEDECAVEIGRMLYKEYQHTFRCMSRNGLAEWYKLKLRDGDKPKDDGMALT